VGRIEDIDDERRFDLIYSIAVLEYIDRPAEAIARLGRALRPGGILLLDVRDRDIGTSATLGLRRFAPNHRDAHGYMRHGYALSELHRLLEGSGLRVRGVRHAIAPPAALAHTVFERLREGAPALVLRPAAAAARRQLHRLSAALAQGRLPDDVGATR